MKFVLDDDAAEEEKVGLKLVGNNDGTVSLNAVDDRGRYWSLMVFKNGRYDLVQNVANHIGIAVDVQGRMKKIK